MLDALYGAGWRSEEELLFTCRDGYQPTVPVARVIAHAAWLAFAREDAPFAIAKLESGRVQDVSLAPFYLIWENLADAQVRSEGDYGWPYQLVGVELIRSRDRFPRMAPPASAPARGAGRLRRIPHPLQPLPPRERRGRHDRPRAQSRRRPGWPARRRPGCAHWIDDPSRIAPGTRMERLNPSLPGRDAVIASIIAYLQAIADHPLAERGDARG